MRIKKTAVFASLIVAGFTLAAQPACTFKRRSLDFPEADAGETPLEPPNAPTALFAQVVSGTRVDLTWVDTAANEDGFTVERRLGEGDASFGAVAGLAANAGAWSDTAVTPNTAYLYRVVAWNDAGASAPSNEVAVTTAPAPPDALVATPGARTVSLAWGAVPGASGFAVRRAGDAGGPYAQIASPGDAGFVDTNLDEGATFFYVVRAVSAAGASDDSTVAVATTRPPAPTGLIADAGVGFVALQWVAAPGAARYSVYRTIVDAGAWVDAGIASAAFFTQSGLANGTPFSLAVVAENDAGASAWSATATATTPAIAPTGLASTGTSGAVLLSWNSVAGALSYNVERSLAGVVTSFSTIGANDAGTFADSTVARCTSYAYRVAAVFPAGLSDASAELIASGGITVRLGVAGSPPPNSPPVPSPPFGDRVAVAATGDSVVAFALSDGLRHRLWGARFSVDAGWSDAGAIDDPDAGTLSSGTVAIDSAGNAVAVWIQASAEARSVYSARSSLLSGWAPGIVISARDAGTSFPRVAIDSTRNGTAAWTETTDFGERVVARRFDLDGGWLAATELEFADGGVSSSPLLAVDSAGGAVVAWNSWDGVFRGTGVKPTRVRASHFSIDAGWTPEEVVEMNDASTSIVGLAAGPSGPSLALWSGATGTGGLGMSGAWFSPDGGWGASIAVEEQSLNLFGRAFAEVLSSGDALVIWAAATSDKNLIQVGSRRYFADGGWEDAGQGTNFDGGVAWGGAAITSTGDALVVFSHQSAGLSRLWRKRFAFDGGWGREEPMTSGGTSSLGGVSVARSVGGVEVVVWQSGNEVWANACW